MKRLSLLLAGLLAWGCGAPQNPNPPQKPLSSPTPPLEDIPSNPASIPEFAPAPEGATPVGFNYTQMSDPISDEAKQKGGFITGAWEVAQDGITQKAGGSGQALTIRRLDVPLASHYRVDVACWPTRYTGTTPERIDQSVGVMALIPYYRDETHYLIMSARARNLEAWACEGFVPGIVWPDTNKLLSIGTPVVAPNTAITMGAEVDLNALTVKVFYNGKEQGTLPLKPEFAKGAGSIALANNGTQVKFTSLRIYNLGPTQAKPTPVPVLATPTPGPTPVAIVPTPAPTLAPRTRITPIPLLEE